MKKILVFDMDGTIADLYGVENWLSMLRTENPFPYEAAKPLYNMVWLASILKALKGKGWKIAVTTWGAKNASSNYNSIVAKIKKEWLERYDFPFDYFFFQSYGTAKNKATKKFRGRQILIDDNKDIRNAWTGETIDATKDILMELQKLYSQEHRKSA